MQSKGVFWGGVALALALIAGWWLIPELARDPLERGGAVPWGERREDGPGVSVAVETRSVTRETIVDLAEYTGTLQPGSQFVLAPKASGRLRHLLVDIGDPVEPGQVVARLDDEEFAQNVAEQQAALEVTEAQLENARAQRDLQQRAYERIAQLREQGQASASEYDIARSEYNAAEANLRVARAQVAQREAALRGAEVRLDYTRVRAEWNPEETADGAAGGGGDGAVRFVGERFVDEGTNVAANEPMISLIDLSSLRAVTFVTDRDLARLEIGQPVTIRSEAVPGESFEGKIERIAPLLREDTRQARVEIRVPNEQRRLSPGFFAGLEVEIEEIENAVVVPRDALTRHDGRRGVFHVVEDDNGAPRVRWVPVTIGVQSGAYVQIIEPELEGEVVTLGQHLLSDGTRIRIPENGRGE